MMDAKSSSTNSSAACLSRFSSTFFDFEMEDCEGFSWFGSVRTLFSIGESWGIDWLSNFLLISIGFSWAIDAFGGFWIPPVVEGV